MTEEDKKTLWGRIEKPIVIILIIILIFVDAFLIFAYMTKKEPYQYPLYAAPTGIFDVEYNETTDTYRLYLSNLSDEGFEIDMFMVTLFNDNNAVQHDLEAILNNENSNITFYDMDDDGKYSIGDEFIIDGDIVEPGTIFKVIMEPGKVAMKIEFGE